MSEVSMRFRGREIRPSGVEFQRELNARDTGHPVVRLESFVDVERFKGTRYQAANWRCQGRSEGRGTQSQTGDRASLKEPWVYPSIVDSRGNLLP